MKVTTSSLIPRISKHDLDSINTIEVLEQENKQLQTKLEDWKNGFIESSNREV